MAGALESSITLQDVLTMVGAKRVPLAPELAGYLALEIAEGAEDGSGDVDPKTVYIAEEGTVALVRRREPLSGDVEASIRAILGRLLEASGSKTPALLAAARKRSTGSLRALAEELEAALIPVNRAAGRRALARLAREVKRVTMRVGRSAPSAGSMPAAQPPPARSPLPPPVRSPMPPPAAAAPAHEPPSAMPPEAPTARREVPAELVQGAVPSERNRGGAGPARPVSVDLEEIEEDAPAPPPVAAAPPAGPGPSGLRQSSRPPPDLRASASDVDSLLEQFTRSAERPDQAVARELKVMAGLDPTPPPPQLAGGYPPKPEDLAALAPRTASRANPAPERASDSGVEALLALSEAVPPAKTGSTRPGMGGGPGGPEHRAPLPPLAPPAPLPPLAPPTPLPADPFAQARARSSNPPATPAQAPISKRAAAARAAAEQRAAPTGPSHHPRASGAPPPPADPLIEDAAASLAEPPPPQRQRTKSQAEIPTGASLRRAALSRISTGEFKRMAKKRSDMWLIVIAMGLVGLGVVVVWSLKPGFLTGRTPEKIAQEKAAAEAAKQAALLAQQAAACKVTLEVTDVPANAEVLIREGQAPVDVDRMPVGARLEFVATAEGFAPKRAVVPAGVSWDTGAGKPRYEVAVQLDKSSGKPKGEVWPPGEPGSEVGGRGPPGTVHIVTTPRGAEVWLLAGLGPEARIEALPCDQDVDVLVAGPTTFRKRVHVPAASFVAGVPEAPADGRFAKVSAK